LLEEQDKHDILMSDGKAIHEARRCHVNVQGVWLATKLKETASLRGQRRCEHELNRKLMDGKRAGGLEVGVMGAGERGPGSGS
jgi:hypothetical protein